MQALLADTRLRSHLLRDMVRSETHSLTVEDNTLTAIDVLLTAFVAGLSARSP